MPRQYFEGLLAEPPITAAGETAVTATSETALWSAVRYTPIAANDFVAGKIYEVHAGGVMSFAATGTLILTPRIGLTVAAGITMGASVVALTTPGATTAHAWTFSFRMVCLTIGAAGVNSTIRGTGVFNTGIPSAGSLPATQTCGGTTATFDASIASGFCLGWTLSVAGTATCQYAYIKSVN